MVDVSGLEELGITEEGKLTGPGLTEIKLVGKPIECTATPPSADDGEAVAKKKDGGKSM